MSEMNFDEMLDDYSKTIRNGEVVEGTVLDVKPDEIILNIGYKADGIITKNEYTNDASVDLTEVVSPGDTMTAKVLKVNDGEGQVLLTYKRLANEKCSERLKEAYENGEVLKAPVTQVLDGGLSVVIDDTRIFIPASLVSDTYERDLTKYQDQEIEFILTEFNPRRRRIIGNRKQLLLAEKEKRQQELLDRIQVGDVIEGKVKNITDFGAFVDLGGADGLLHISEMSWGRVDNPRKIYKVGDDVRVFIKNINGTKIALSVKFPEENPWNNAADKFAPGTIITGKVARMTDFGAFVELEPGVDALLHVSQISREHVDKPSDVLSIGEEIQAKIVDFNADDHKISLSMKALAPATPKKPKKEASVETAEAETEAAETAMAAAVAEAGIAAEDVAEAESDLTADVAEGAAEAIVDEADAAAEAVEEAEAVLEEEAAEDVEAIEEAVEEEVAEEVAAEEIAIELDAAAQVADIEEALEESAPEGMTAEDIAEEEAVLEEATAEMVAEEEAELEAEAAEALDEIETEIEEDAVEAVEEIEEEMEDAVAEAVSEDAADIAEAAGDAVDALDDAVDEAEEDIAEAAAEEIDEIADEAADAIDKIPDEE